MDGQEVKGKSVESLVDELESYCLGHELSLNELRERLALIPPSALRTSTFFHRVCGSWHVTLEVVDFILNALPGAAHVASRSWAYPIHCACGNVNCPSSVIKLLVDKNPAALGQPFDYEDGDTNIYPYHEDYGGPSSFREFSWEGLPISYYFMNQSNANIDLDTVKMMVEAYPQALVARQDVISPVAHLLVGNPNIGNLAGNIVQFLSTTNPSSLRLTNGCNGTPLHVACCNRNMDSKTVRLLLNAWPESASHRDVQGALPIHMLSKNSGLGERKSLEILTLLIEAHPLGVGEHGGDGCLAIHHAVRHTSPKFCNMLLLAHPDSLSIAAAWVEEEYEFMLDFFTIWCPRDHLLIHRASDPRGLKCSELRQMAGRIKFLLTKDPDSASKEVPRQLPYFKGLDLPLHLFCSCAADVAIDALKLLFDAYPEAICITDSSGRTPLNWAVRKEHGHRVVEVISFLEAQLAYARTAQDSRAMTTLDHNGWLPLHHALHENAPLGSIKLLTKGNPFALRVADLQRSFLLHIACEFATAGVVHHLVDLGGSPLNAADSSNNSLLHRACRGGNCETVNYLLGINAWGALERNTSNKLPIHLLWECEEEKVDRNSPDYVETIWRLMLANPEDAVCGFA